MIVRLMLSKIPVTILTGFLGAGKTTLLNRLLASPRALGIAVIVNEFGEVGIDGKLISHRNGNIIELSNGAMCCAAMGDTVRVLAQLLDLGKDKRVARVIIETTGLADPFPLVKAFLNRPSLAKAYALDAIVTVVDAFHLVGSLEQMPEAKEQLAAADIVLLNKTDLIDETELARVEATIVAVNPHAEIRHTLRSKTDLATLFDAPALGKIQRPYAKAEGFTKETHGHHAGISSIALKESRPLSLDKLAHWIGKSLLLNADQLMRYKGILYIKGRPERFVFQGVHHQFETLPDRPWREGEEKRSDIVLIGKNLDRATFEESFKECAQT